MNSNRDWSRLESDDTCHLIGRNDCVVADRGKVLWRSEAGLETEAEMEDTGSLESEVGGPLSDENEPVEAEPGIRRVDSPCGGR